MQTTTALTANSPLPAGHPFSESRAVYSRPREGACAHGFYHLLGRRRVCHRPPKCQRFSRNGRDRLADRINSYNRRHKRPRQHQGPLTAAYQRVAWALVFFHNHGVVDPSQHRIAARAKCGTTTVANAIQALEQAGILTWMRQVTRRDGQVMRDCNAYQFNESLVPSLNSKNRGTRPNRYEIPIGEAETNAPPVDNLLPISRSDALEGALSRLAGAADLTLKPG